MYENVGIGVRIRSERVYGMARNPHLGAIAARTERAGLGAMVTGVTYRNPAYLAKVLTTLDVVSSGRAILGIGAAWNDDEHAGYGFGFPPVTERMERLEEALQICRAMFTQEAPSFTGRYYAIAGALNWPRPIRPGGIPILVGGSGERKTLRLVAMYADACNVFGDVATVRRKLEVLNRHCEAVGRDPAEITKARLGGLVITATTAEADRRHARWPRRGDATWPACATTWRWATRTRCASSWQSTSTPVSTG